MKKPYSKNSTITTLQKSRRCYLNRITSHKFSYTFAATILLALSLTAAFATALGKPALSATAAVHATKYGAKASAGADLTLSYSLLTAGPYADGSTVKIRLTASNIGNAYLSGGVVQHVLPAELSYVSHKTSGSAYEYQPGENAWRPNWGNFNPGTTYSIDITATINSTTTVTHNLSIVAGNNDDADLTNNSVTVSVPIYTNAKPVAHHITTGNVLPNGSPFPIEPLLATDSDGTISKYVLVSVPGNWVGTLYVNGVPATAGQELTPAQAAQLTFRAANGQEGTHTFTYTAVDDKDVAAAAPATYSIPIVNGVDIVLTSQVITPAPFATGQNITLRVTAKNQGTHTINGDLNIASVLAPGLSYVSSSAGSAYNPATNTWKAAQYYMGTNATATLDIVATVTGSVPFMHTTSAVLPSSVTDVNPSSNSARYAIINGVTAFDVENDIDKDATGLQSINGLYAMPVSGHIASYTILSLPAASSGILYVAGSPATVGQVLTPSQASQIAFERATGFTSGSASFTYTATENNGVTATEPATYRVAIPTAMPVTLLSFTAVPQQQHVVLSWATATELNNDYFAIERSPDGKTFELLGKVPGKGTVSQKTNYTYQDNQAPTGTTYYRLKQVDTDGGFEYSRTVAVEKPINKHELLARLYPTQTDGIVYLDLTMLPPEVYTVRIISPDGRILQQLKAGADKVHALDVRQLQNGRYFVQIQGLAAAQTLLLFKQ